MPVKTCSTEVYWIVFDAHWYWPWDVHGIHSYFVNMWTNPHNCHRTHNKFLSLIPARSCTVFTVSLLSFQLWKLCFQQQLLSRNLNPNLYLSFPAPNSKVSDQLVNMVKRSVSKEPHASRSPWKSKQKIKGARRLTSGNCLLTSSPSQLYKVQICHVHVSGNTK